MASPATIASSAAIIKELYPFGDVPWEVYRKYNFFNKVEKDTELVGNPVRIPIQSEMTMGASATFTNAQTNIQPSTYNAFALTRVTDFSLARIDNHALAAADGGEGSFVRLWEREIDSAMMSATWATEIQCYRTGTGSRSQVASGQATTTITLTSLTDIVCFGVGMTVAASATDGGAQRVGTQIVTGIDRANGTLTAATAWSTAIASLAANDFLYRDGDQQNGGASALVLTGLQGWLAGGTTPGTLFGLNRNIDPVRYAGQVYNATGVSLEEAMYEAYARAGIEGGMPDSIWMHPRQKAALMKSLESKTIYSKESGSPKGTVGFGEVTLDTDDGKVSIFTSPFIPFNMAFMLQMDTFELGSIGKCPAIQDFDSEQYLRVSNADQLEVRIFSYYNLLCKAPGWNVRLTNFGN